MKILDNNALNYVMKNNVRLSEPYFITPDVKEEFEAWFDEKLPGNVLDVGEEAWFDGAEYLRNYQHLLNLRTGRSFGSMSGFGDLSIRALLRTQKASSASALPGMVEETLVVSGDAGLIKKIAEEFSDTASEFDAKVTIVPHEAYSW